MSRTPATLALVRAGVAHTVHAFAHDPDLARTGAGYGEEAAAALGVDPARVFKTLVASVDRELVMGVVPVVARLELKALAAAVGGKRAALADPQTAQRATGYVVGGISPVGGRRRLRTVVDSSALGHSTLFVSGGRRGLDLELAPAELVTVTGAVTAAIASR
jgi:Cys-tRNA(Pro)/Cys-tRNA(Cys) deacylase